MRLEVLLSVLLPAAFVTTEQIASFKSFEDAVYDCAQYYLLDDAAVQQFLADPEHQGNFNPRLTRCVLLDLAAWDDETGIKNHVIWRFFDEPCYLKNDYKERTRGCTAGLQHVARQDVNEWAQQSLKCYFLHYGKLIATKKMFIPLTDSAMLQLKREEYLLAETPWNVLEEFATGNFSREYELAKALFIGAVRGGYLDFGTKELYMDRLFMQFSFSSLLSDESVRCQTKVTRSFHTKDPVVLLFEKIKRCLEIYKPLLELLQQAATQLVAKKPEVCGGKSNGFECNECATSTTSSHYYYPRDAY